MKIRKADVKDARKIYLMQKKTKEMITSDASEYDFFTAKEIEDWIRNPKDKFVLVAENDSKISGFLLARMVTRYWCVIEAIVVEKKFRKTGIGTKLLEELYKRLKNYDVQIIQAFVRADIKEPQNFWKDRGFKERKKFIWFDKRL